MRSETTINIQLKAVISTQDAAPDIEYFFEDYDTAEMFLNRLAMVVDRVRPCVVDISTRLSTDGKSTWGKWHPHSTLTTFDPVAALTEQETTNERR